MQRVGDHLVDGVAVDLETRCAHYDEDWDVVAIALPCCDRFYACIRCHLACADHEPSRWPRSSFGERAVLCGVCGEPMPIAAYLAADASCPGCDHPFNPGCVAHYDRYFACETDPIDG